MEAAFVPKRLVNATGETCDFENLQGKTRGGVLRDRQSRRLSANARFLRVWRLKNPRLRTFPDHHHYTAEDFESLAQWAGEQKAAALLTTQKDLVKIPQTHLGDVPVWAVEIGAEWFAGRVAESPGWN